MADKHRFRVFTRPSAKNGTPSVVMSLISLAVMIADIIISFAAAGKAGTVTGALGLGGALIAVYGFVLGIRGLGEKKVDHRLAFIGSVLGGIIAIIWLALFVVGMK